jgi:hypothetical protein
MRKIIFFLFIFLGATYLCAQSSGTGANFLKLGVGPRAIGLGSAYTGVGDDVYTLYWNPAGIGFIRRWELSAMYNQYFADMYYGAISGVKQYRFLGSRKSAIGFGIFYHGMSDWDATLGNTSAGSAVEKASASNLLAIISAGQRLDWLLEELSLGVNAKIGFSKLMEHSATSLAADFGIMYKMEVWHKPLTLGFTLQNLGFQSAFIAQKSELPTGYRFGVSYRILGCPWHHLLIASDLAKYKYGKIKFGLGAEYWLHGIVGFRGGYNYSPDALGDISFGASVRFDAFNSGVQSDYSQTDFGNVLGYDYKGAMTLQAVRPEPFFLTGPENGQDFCRYDEVTLTWETSEDPDFCDVIRYRVLVDPDSQKVRAALNLAKANPGPISEVLVDLTVSENQAILPPLEVVTTYFWTALAVDRAGHFFAPEEIKWFSRSEADIWVSDFKIIPTQTLPEPGKAYQGKVKVTLVNRGSCDATDFKIQIVDTISCEFCPPAERVVVDTLFVQLLAGKSTDTYFIDWETLQEGRHHFYTFADVDSQVIEMNENNNEGWCSSLTVPRGKFWTSTEIFRTKQIIFDSCKVPVIPVVFFDSAATVVGDAFVQQTVCEPEGCLITIAQRLQQNPGIEITLAGYVDPLTETDLAPNLADERAQQVRDVLVNQLGVPARQVVISKAHTRTEPRIRATNNSLIIEENRRVEIEVASPAIQAELFKPLNICVNNAWRDSLVFYSNISSFSGCSAWQLNIKDGKSLETLQTIPFKLSRFRTNQQDSVAWVGNNFLEQLVEPNRNYGYTVKAADKLGRWFETEPQGFRIDVDTLNRQERHVFPMKFNENVAIFEFYENQMARLAERFIENSAYRALVLGTTCEIGTLESNFNLVTKRQRSQDKFIALVEQKLREKYGADFSPDAHLEPVIARIDTAEGRYNLPAKNITRLKGALGAPLTYYSPCCCYHDIFYGDPSPLGRNYNRRIEIVLYTEQPLHQVADK